MKLFLRGIVIFGIASLPQFALADPDWTNQGPDTNFDNPLNWITSSGTGAVPGATDSAHIFPGFIVSGAGLIVTQGGPETITINAAGNESVESVLVSSNFEGNTQPNGVLNLNIGGTLTIGADASTDAGLVVTGTSTLNFTGNLQMPSAGEVLVGTTASFIDAGQVTGAGTLNLTSSTVNLDGTGQTHFIIGSGTTGVVVQNNSTVTTGELFTVGGTGGTGSYTVEGNSVLNVGTPGNPMSASYLPEVGSGTGATGELFITGNSTVNATNPDTLLQIGVGGGSGTIVQSGTSTVNLGGTGSSVSLGEVGGQGIYELISGNLNISGLLADVGESSTGAIFQSGGVLTVSTSTSFTIGDGGPGTYELSAGTADFQDGFTVGNISGATGTITQSGGALTAGNAVVIGEAGVGTYNLEGGSSNLNSGVNLGGTSGNGTLTQSGSSMLTVGGIFKIGMTGGTGTYNLNGGTVNIGDGIEVGANGTINQRGGTISLTNMTTQSVTIASGGVYNLAGGTLITGGTIFTGAGHFNFAGGTVTPASEWMDTFDGTITGTSTILTSTAGATLSGNLSGNGNLNVAGQNGTVTLTGSNSGSWGSTISGSGTLAAMSVHSLSQTGSFVVGSGSTFSIGSSGAATDIFAGSVSGTGNFVTGASDTSANKLVLSGTTNLTGGSTTLGSGGFGSLEVDRGTITNVNGSAGNTTDTFDVGNGATTGTVTLLGSNILPMATVNSGSTLLGGGSLTGNLVNLGTLGTLGSLNNPASFPISGTLNSSGTLVIHSNGSRVDAFGSAGSPLTSATVSGSVNVIGVGSITNAPIVYTSGGVTTPGTITTNASTALFSSTVSVVGTNLVLSTHQNLLSGFAQTPNQAAVAGSIDNIINNGPPFQQNFVAVLGTLNQLTADELPVALEEFTPESLQYARDIAFENSTFMVERINAVASNLRGGYEGLDSSEVSVISPGFDSSLGRSLGSLLAYNDPAFHSAAPNGVNYYPGGESGTPSPASSPSPVPTWDSSSQVISDSPDPYLATVKPGGKETPRMGVFIGGDVVLADLNQSQSGANAPSSKASYTAGDATAGVSFRMTNHLAAGILFDYNHTDAKTDSSGSKTKVDSYSPALFATYFDGGFYATGIASFGYNSYTNTRNISFLNETATSKPDGQQYVGDIDVGYDFHPDKAWVVGPTLGVTYTHLDVDSFSETGASVADLSVQSQSADSLRSRLGGHLIYQTNTGDVLLQPNFTAMWQHEYLDSSSGITSSFNSFSTTPFTIDTAAPSRDSALIGVGLTATLNNSMALYLNYLADVGADDYWAQSVIGGFKARF